MTKGKNIHAFFALVRAGLWADINNNANANHNLFDEMDWSEVYRLAEEQSVIGLVADGIDRFKFQVSGFKIPQEWALQFVGHTLQLEQRNREMNAFIGKLIQRLRDEDIYTLLVKGQGIAQCYEKPLWRACGDVDLYLSRDNYEKAKKYLIPLAQYIETEDKKRLHLGLTIDGWVVELHGTLFSRLSKRVDKGIEEAHKDVFYGGNVRSWMCGRTQVFLPGVDSDIIFVFSHILQHYFSGGIGLRQVCDWCRLLFFYRAKFDLRLLESRLKRMDLMSEWMAFASLAVNWLGMPEETMPFYSPKRRWGKKADIIVYLLLEAGNFGQGRDNSYKNKYPSIIANLISFWIYTKYNIIQFSVFPLDAIKSWLRIITLGIKMKLKMK